METGYKDQQTDQILQMIPTFATCEPLPDNPSFDWFQLLLRRQTLAIRLIFFSRITIENRHS